MLGSTCCQDVDRVGHATARQQLLLQLLGSRTCEWRHLHATLGQGIGEHDTRTTSMGHNGEVLASETG